MNRGSPAGLLAWGLLTLGATVVAAGTPIDETVDARADGTVVVENLAGSVTVEGWDENRVHVGGELGKGTERLEIDPDGDEVSIQVVLPRRNKGNIEATDLVIKVPRGSTLEIETVSADVRVTGVKGEVGIETVSGRISSEGSPKGVLAESVSGTIEVTGGTGFVEAETVSGKIEIRGATERSEASTTSGEIDIRGDGYRVVECASVSGSIHLEGSPGDGAEVEIENHSGSVTIVVPSNVGATFEVETFSGEIVSEFDGRVRREEYGPGASLRVSVGDGNAEFMVSSFSGRVQIRKK